MSTLVDRRVSRWVEVNVYAAEDAEHFWWCRRPGKAGPPRFSVMHDYTVLDPVTGVELTTPTVDGDTLVYRVGGPSSAAAWLAQPDAHFRATALESIHLAISAVHTASAGPAHLGAPTSAPAPLQRLGAHLADSSPTPAVTQWRAVLEQAWGVDPTAALTTALEEHLRHQTRLTHGGLSIGGIIPSTTSLPTSVLSGEDWGYAAPGHDLGWLIGELLELVHSSAAAGTGLVEVLTATLRRLLAGAEHRAGTATAARLRVALHAEDYAHFVGWDETLRDRAALLAALHHSDTWQRTGRAD